tara:strand:+ start:618 stop:1124 length:507 start_codon:yes stop_codon:yes gene_type:complete
MHHLESLFAAISCVSATNSGPREFNLKRPVRDIRTSIGEDLLRAAVDIINSRDTPVAHFRVLRHDPYSPEKFDELRSLAPSHGIMELNSNLSILPGSRSKSYIQYTDANDVPVRYWVNFGSMPEDMDHAYRIYNSRIHILVELTLSVLANKKLPLWKELEESGGLTPS